MSTYVFTQLIDGDTKRDGESASVMLRWICTTHSPIDMNEANLMTQFAQPEGYNTGIAPVAPYTYDGLNRAAVHLEHRGGGVWYCTAEYGSQPTIAAVDQINTFTQYGGLGTPRGPEFNGDTTGTTVHITQSLNTVWKIAGKDVLAAGVNLVVNSNNTFTPASPDTYTPSAGDIGGTIVTSPGNGWSGSTFSIQGISAGDWQTTPTPFSQGLQDGQEGGNWVLYGSGLFSGGSGANYGGAIGVTLDSVEGTDIVVPKFEFTVSGVIAPFDMSNVNAWYQLTGRTNLAAFWGFAVGEVLYMGVTAATTDGIQFRISHKFAAQPTQWNIRITSSIYIPNKGGWEYLWVAYAPDKNANIPIQTATAAYVEQVYPAGDFSQLGLG